jgi:hypothetical protein
MDQLLIKKYAKYLADQLAQVNPYREGTSQHALYELGLLRSILAQCMLLDSRNEQVLKATVIRLKQQYEQES